MSQPPVNRDLSGTDDSKDSKDLRTILARVRIGRSTAGVLYYEVQDTDRSTELVKVLHDMGFQVSLVTDVRIKELLPTPHYRSLDQSVVLRIEWTTPTVDSIWPSIRKYPMNLLGSQSIRYTVAGVSALATLVFILLSFTGLFLSDDKVVATTFLGCGLGCFLLLCLLLFVDSDD